MASIMKMTRLVPALRASMMQRPTAYVISERSMTNFSDKERGEETVHFRKADEELLRKLLQKVTLCDPFLHHERHLKALRLYWGHVVVGQVPYCGVGLSSTERHP